MAHLRKIIAKINFSISNLTSIDKISMTLFKAIEENDIDSVRYILSLGVKKTHFFKCKEALLLAAQSNNIETFKLILPETIQESEHDYFADRILYIAAQNGNNEIIKLILDKIRLKEIQIKVIMLIATQNNHKDTCSFLIQYFDKIPLQEILIVPLFKAVSNKNLEIVSMLLEIVDCDSAFFRQPLLFQTTSRDIMSYLIDNGANIHAIDKFNATALIKHAGEGNLELTQLLLAKGADINHQDQDGHSALFLASAKGHLKIVELLIENGADCNLRTDDSFWHNGESPFDIAIENQNLNMVDLFVKNGANVNYQNNLQPPALHSAISSQNVGLVNILVSGGARKDYSFLGETAMDLALKHNNKEIIELLKSDITTKKNITLDRGITNKKFSYLFDIRQIPIPEMKKYTTNSKDILKYRV
jgi:ankyrin repeat protein